MTKKQISFEELVNQSLNFVLLGLQRGDSLKDILIVVVDNAISWAKRDEEEKKEKEELSNLSKEELIKIVQRTMGKNDLSQWYELEKPRK